MLISQFSYLIFILSQIMVCLSIYLICVLLGVAGSQVIRPFRLLIGTDLLLGTDVISQVHGLHQSKNIFSINIFADFLKGEGKKRGNNNITYLSNGLTLIRKISKLKTSILFLIHFLTS